MRVNFLFFFAAAVLPTVAQTWDSSGNGMLNGTYYFRQVLYVVGDNYGDLNDAVAMYDQVAFDGNGHYTMTGVHEADAQGYLQTNNFSGTYSISASGYGFISNPLSTGDYIYGLVSQSGVFVGSSTEAAFNDLFIAAPAPASSAAATAFKGSFTLAGVDLSGAVQQLYGVQYALGTMCQLNPDGAGNLGSINITGYAGLGGSSVYTQLATSVKYVISNGAVNIGFPTSPSATLISGQEYLYISPDGNFLFGGSPVGFDFFVGVRNPAGAPTFGGLYYQAGVDEDTSTLATGGSGLLDTYYGSLQAGGGVIVDHQRQTDVFFAYPEGYTYSDTYSVKSDGTYSNGVMKYVVGPGGAVRIGSGIGPYLGINVALAAPAPAGTGVYINPQGIVNGASFAPFTAGVSPGELITIYGSNLAPGTQVASAIPFPTTLAGVQVSINNLAAPLYYVTPGQIAAIVPYGVGKSIANIQVVNNNTPSNTVSAYINLTTPGVFTAAQTGLGDGAVLHADFTPVTAKSPAQIGETVLVYLTGLGAVNPAISDGSAGPANPLSNTANTITAGISGVTATVTYAGLAPQLAGLYQVNVTIPAGVTAGENTIDISGPDSYASAASILIGTGSSSNAAAQSVAVESAVSRKGPSRRSLPQGAAPRRKRPMPCLTTESPCK
ncbi:MAG TPA: IPT/TIG domain-containing protein [Candidatus Sulfopaludibacter sp.]|nr:IPT/TIG domain-containing protein [Candidatus Sulfopaludibacter sp.]